MIERGLGSGLEALEIHIQMDMKMLMVLEDGQNRDKRAAAIRDIAQTISRSVNDVKKKLDSLRNQHRRELRLMCTSKKSGAGSDEIHTHKLWCFDILSFLNDGDSMRPAVSNMSSTASNQTTETVSEDVSDSEIYTGPLLLELQDSPRASTVSCVIR
ncbi:uncharacterized protein LOC143027305 [Oratosquilla oratoria]|uniref:uncharacterized protein LOC143027305 n=1 Tax=Oratosquilla oratoria TaxID=337810 RepID=UPI003F7745F4